MCLSHVPSPLTLDARIYALPAGCALAITAAGAPEVTRRLTWRESHPLRADEADAQAECAALLREALRRSLAATATRGGPIGVALSGGLDSSLVAALLAEAGADARLYALDFGPPFDEELPFAQAVADRLGWPLRRVRARAADVGDAIGPVAKALHQPFGDGVVVPWYLLARAMADDGIQVMFTGEFGDQLFGGWANKPIIAASLYDAAPHAPDDDDRARFLSTYLKTYHRFWGQARDLYAPPTLRVLVEGGVVGGEQRWIADALAASGASTVLHRLRAANLWLKGAQNIAPRVAQAASAAGVAVASPLMDAPLARWTFSLAPPLLLRGACEKYLLKRVAAPLLPEAVVWREKRGMGVPITAWCQGPGWRRMPGRLWWRAKAALAPRRISTQGLLNASFIQALRRGEPGTYDPQRPRRQGERLWLLVMWMAWAEAHGVCAEDA
jgi:asparagine synthase (glutamine-hydrolysing)